MVYETAIVLRADSSEDIQAKVKQTFADILKQFEGEIIVSDDWGVKTFAQPTQDNEKRGLYLYFMYKSNSKANAEIERTNRINENIIKFLTVKLGVDSKIEEYQKTYQINPGAKTENKRELEKEKKIFSKKKNCWFSANKTAPDWKDPNSYSWLVNEFGKISPARITGLRPKYQRHATTAIKRARCIGLLSYVSNHTAY